jgi:hypothetical protein
MGFQTFRGLSVPILVATLLSTLNHQVTATPLPPFILPNLHLPVINDNVPIQLLSTSLNVGGSLIQFGDVSNYQGGVSQAIIDALTSICNKNGCDGGRDAIIENINFGLSGANSIQTGKLSFKVSNSDFSNIDQRDALIRLVASTFETIATGANCEEIHFAQGCITKRVLDEGGDGRPEQVCENKKVTNCKSVNFLGSKITDPNVSEGALLATMDVSVSFDGSVVPFVCSDFIDGITSAVEFFPQSERFLEVLGTVAPVCQFLE